MKDIIKVKVMWGFIDGQGFWFPNYLLNMNTREQYLDNLKKGFQIKINLQVIFEILLSNES